jgi:hypothetical protein
VPEFYFRDVAYPFQIAWDAAFPGVGHASGQSRHRPETAVMAPVISCCFSSKLKYLFER